MSAMKPGEELLRSVPASWKVVPLASAVTVIGGATPSKDEPRFWMGDIPWVSPKDMKVDVISDSEDHVSEAALGSSSLTLVEPPAVLVVIRGMILAHTVPVALTAGCLTVNQDMKALRPRTGLDARFLAYQLRAHGPTLLSMVEEAGHGTRCLRTDLWRRLMVAVPPMQTQHALAALLDRKTAELDDLIRTKQRLHAAIESRRRDRLAHAATRGLASAPLRASGVEWMGDIPAHWSGRRLSMVAVDMQTGPFGSQLHACDYVDRGVPLVNPSHLVDGRIVPDLKSRVSAETLHRLRRHQLREGDLVFGRRGELGRCAVVTKNEEGWLCGTGSLRVRVNPDLVEPRYVALVSSLTRSREWLVLQSVGATMDNLNTSILGHLPLPIPPLDEQRAIIEFAQRLNETTDAVLLEVESSIAKLQEYRRVVIAAAVAGRVDVAAQPQEAA